MPMFDEIGKPIALLFSRESLLPKTPMFDEKGKSITLHFSREFLLPKMPIFDEKVKPIALPLRSKISSSQNAFF